MRLYHCIPESVVKKQGGLHVIELDIDGETYTLELDRYQNTLAVSFTHEGSGTATRSTTTNAVKVLRRIAAEVTAFVRARPGITQITFSASGLGTRAGERESKARIYRELLRKSFPNLKYFDRGSYQIIYLNQ